MKTLKDIATARLLNQHLLRPLFTAPQEVVSWMGAMQAQDFSMCRWAVGVRMRKPSEAGVIEALNKGDIIRSHLNRSTWQLVTKEDYHWMMPLHRERSIRSWCAFAKQSGNPISDKMMDNSRELLTNILGGKKHLTREDIIPFYQEIDIDNAHTVRHLLAVAEADHFTFLQFHERISFSSKTLLIRSSPLSDVKSAVISFFPSTIFTQ
mgnify:CR=1 FL=1